MSANVAKVAVGRAEIWHGELRRTLTAPRTAQQQVHLANLLAEAQSAFPDLLASIQTYAEGLREAGEALSRDGLPLPQVCGEARALASVARTLIGEIRP